MRLSDFENEKALDLLANIIEPATEIMSDEGIAKKYRSGQPKLLIVKDILRNHKKQAMEIIAAMHGVDVEHLKVNPISLTRDILEIINDPELQAVFTLQSQTEAAMYSGSVTESTEEKEQ